MIGTLENALKQFDIELSDSQKSQFEKYYSLLVEWNEKMNLTAINEKDEVAVKHFADSVSLLSVVDIPQGASVIDVGTGAGFPGIPLKIVRPDIKLTLLDSLNKRLIFLQNVCDELGFSAEITHARAEEGGQNVNLRERYDFAVSRAVAQLNMLCEFCLPFVKLGGSFISMKGPNAENELETAKNAVNTLGGKIKKVNQFTLIDDSSRTVIEIEKIKQTPKKYPRHGGKIKKQPL